MYFKKLFFLFLFLLNLNIIYCAENNKTCKNLAGNGIKKLDQQEFNWDITKFPIDLIRLVIYYLHGEFLLLNTVNLSKYTSYRSKFILSDKCFANVEQSVYFDNLEQSVEKAETEDAQIITKLNLFDIKSGNLLSTKELEKIPDDLIFINNNIIALSFSKRESEKVWSKDHKTYTQTADDPFSPFGMLNTILLCYIENDKFNIFVKLNNNYGTPILTACNKTNELACFGQADSNSYICNIRIWDLNNFKRIEEVLSFVTTHTDNFEISPNGKYIAVCTRSGLVSVLTRGKKNYKVDQLDDLKEDFLNNYRLFITSDSKNIIIVYTKNLTKVRAFSDTPHFFDCTLYVYDVQNLENIKRLTEKKIYENSRLRDSMFLIDKYLYIIFSNSNIRIINCFDDKIETISNFKVSKKELRECRHIERSISPNCKYMLVLHQDLETAKIWQNQAVMLLELLNKNREKN